MGAAHDTLGQVEAEADAVQMRPVSLAFTDPALEHEFRDEYFPQSLTSNRAALILATVQWAVFGLLALGVLDEDTTADFVVRYLVLIPAVLFVLGLTFLPSYGHWWTRATIAILLFNGIVWATQRTLIDEVGAVWGYAPMMVILAFAFTLTRLRFLEASISGIILIVYALVTWALFTDDTAVDLMVAAFFMFAIQLTGMAGA